MSKLTAAQAATRELKSRMVFHQLMNVAMMMCHSDEQQIRLSNGIAHLQADPKTTYAQLVEVLSDHITNEVRHGFETS